MKAKAEAVVAAAAAAAAGEEDEDMARAARAAEAAVEVARAKALATSQGKAAGRTVQPRLVEVYEVHFSLDGGRTRTLLGDVQPVARTDGALQIPIHIPGVTGRVNLQKKDALVGGKWISSFKTAPRKGAVRLYAKIVKRAVAD